MEKKFRRGFFGLKVKETNEYIADLEAKLQKEKFEYDEILKSLETEFTSTSRNQSFNDIKKQETVEVKKDAKSDMHPDIDILKHEINDYLDKYRNKESDLYKKLIDMKLEFEATEMIYTDKLKELINKQKNFIKTLEEKP